MSQKVTFGDISRNADLAIGGATTGVATANFEWHVECSRSSVDRKELEQRSLRFAKDVCAYAEANGSRSAIQPAVHQLLRASSGAAANYRAAGRARSRKEFVAKLGLVNEEADEAVFWLEYIESAHDTSEHTRLLTESRELRAIFAAAYGTARQNRR